MVVAMAVIIGVRIFLSSSGIPVDDLSESPEGPTYLPDLTIQTPPPPDPHAGFPAIRAADPAFTVEAFEARVAEMFLAYHEALARGDLAPTRRFVDEGYYASVAPGIDADSAKHTARVEGVKDIRPATARHEDGLDVVRVMIVATTADDEPLTEYWELIRRRGAQSKPELSLTRCPNCGAPIDGVDPTRCAYCGERLADPAYDWVVRKISAD
jgi:hypothetical protein